MLARCNRMQGVKIARVSTVRLFVDTQLHGQISAMVQAGAQVTVVASEGGLEREILGIHYVSINIPRKVSLIKDIVALVRLWFLFLRSGFDIVHSTTPKAGLLCCLAAKFAMVPIRLHTFTGQPWACLTGVKRFVLKGSDKLIAKLNTQCYADSFSQKNFIVDNGIATSRRISVLGAGSLSGVDLARFNPSRFGGGDKIKLRAVMNIPQTSRILLFAGRLSRDKGVIELLKAFEEVVTEGIDAVLVMLGPIETDIDSSLSGVAQAVKEKVIMPGFSSEPEKFMAIADILLLPSYREGFGTVVIEAAAMGVPAIGTDIYGLSDAIVDGETGLLVPTRSAEKLASAIKVLLRDSNLRFEMSVNARKRVKSEFSDVRVNGLLMDEYARLLAANRIL